MLLVTDYEQTQSFCAMRHAATGDVESPIPLLTSLVSTPLLRETAQKLIDDGVGEMTSMAFRPGIPSMTMAFRPGESY